MRRFANCFRGDIFGTDAPQAAWSKPGSDAGGAPRRASPRPPPGVGNDGGEVLGTVKGPVCEKGKDSRGRMSGRGWMRGDEVYWVDV